MNQQPGRILGRRTGGRFRRAVAAIAVVATAGALALAPATPAAAAPLGTASRAAAATPGMTFDLDFLLAALRVVLQQAQLRRSAIDKAAAQRKAEQDKAEQDKAERDKAERDKAERDKAERTAAEEKAAKDKTAKEQAAEDKAKRVWKFKAVEALNGRKAKTPNSKWAKVYAKGSTLRILCQAYGSYAYGSPIWDKTTDGLWVTDHYVLNYTHNNFVKGMPRCDRDPKPKNLRLPVRLNSTQIANAKLIIAVGKGYHIPERGWKVAIATAMQESRLQNLSGGDRDSVGMFQQRPSTGWGSVRQCTARVLAIRAFYGVATHTHNPGLTDIGGWQKMSIARAAQAVQRSAVPSGYAKWEKLASALVTNYGDQVKSKR